MNAEPDRLDAESGRLDAEPDFLSGTSGAVGGLDGARRGLSDRLHDARELFGGRRLRLALAARGQPPTRRITVLSVVRPEHRARARATHAELLRSRHEVQLYVQPLGEHAHDPRRGRFETRRGRFENLNRLLAAHPLAQDASDWLLTIDDDVVLPRGFLDRLLFLAERFSLDLAQPAHRLRSHAAWPLTRRQPGAVARRTNFVEIGPVTLFARSAFSTLLPFPELRMGWGLDLHWSALAREHGWRLGAIDAVAIAHIAAPAASAYSREQAIAEAHRFLADRPYLRARQARTLSTYTRW